MRYKHSWSSLNWPLGWKILQHLWMHLHLDYQLKTVFWCISHISCSPKLWLCLCVCFVFAFSPTGFICLILYFLSCYMNECILLSLFRVRVSVFVFVFCPCLCICYFLMSNKNVSRLVLSPDSLPTAFAFSPVSVGVCGSYSVSLSCLSVSLLFGFPRGPRGLLFCCCLCFFSDVPLSFFFAVFGFICCLCLRHYLWCQMRMFSDRGSPQGVEKLGSFRAISSQHPDRLPPFIIVSYTNHTFLQQNWFLNVFSFILRYISLL